MAETPSGHAIRVNLQTDLCLSPELCFSRAMPRRRVPRQLSERQLSQNWPAPLSRNAEAHDFFNRGGFAVQEEILIANLNKLGLELEALSKELGPK